MLIFQLLKILVEANVKNDKRTRYLDNLSLIPPHVGANGREEYFDFDNHFLIKTKTRRDHTQLGYKAPESFGIVKTKENVKFKNIETTIEFTLQDISKGGKYSGFGFWLVSNPDNQPGFYGGNKNFKGCGVVVDLEGTPFVKFIDRSNTNRKGVPISSPENQYFKINLVSQDKKFIAKIFISDKEHILYEGPLTLPDKVYIAITSYSGSSKSTIKLERIYSQSFMFGGKKTSFKGERSGKKGYIYLLGACAIVGLAYYLYNKEKKEFIMKN